MELKYIKNGDYFIPNIELSSEHRNINLDELIDKAKVVFFLGGKEAYFYFKNIGIL